MVVDIVPVGATMHVLQDLTPFRVYKVTVSAVNDLGQGQAAETTFETGETCKNVFIQVLVHANTEYSMYFRVICSADWRGEQPSFFGA